jgi:hypothetical protein
MKNGGSFHSFLYVYQRVKGLQLLVFSAHVRMFGRIVKNAQFLCRPKCVFLGIGQGHSDILRAVSWSPCGRKVRSEFSVAMFRNGDRTVTGDAGLDGRR